MNEEQPEGTVRNYQLDALNRMLAVDGKPLSLRFLPLSSAASIEDDIRLILATEHPGLEFIKAEIAELQKDIPKLVGDALLAEHRWRTIDQVYDDVRVLYHRALRTPVTADEVATVLKLRVSVFVDGPAYR